jgi:SAM-dependent methyltransferase
MTTTEANRTDYQARRSDWIASVMASRDRRVDSSFRYKRTLWRLLGTFIPRGSSVLQVGCGTGDVLASLKPRDAIGIEPSPALAAEARRRHPELEIVESSIESFSVGRQFEYIVLSDVLIDCYDVDDLLGCVHKVADESSRVVVTHYSQMWRPLLKILRILGLARPRFGNTWFSPADTRAALNRCGFEIIADSPEILLPVAIPVLSAVANRFLARLPVLNMFCLHHAYVARKAPQRSSERPSVTVVVPARNEAGNVPRLMAEIPQMGSFTEILFVEGNSTDDTWQVLQRAVTERNDPLVRLMKQPGRGKGDAVRAGFAAARGEILMILDADLTVPAEMLPRFYEVVASGSAEFANGTRLVYRMDDRAMQFLNLLANHFFARAFTYVIGQPVRDTLCGTKVLKRTTYDRIAANRSYFGEFDPFGDFDLLFGAARMYARIVDVPIRYRERVYGETNIQRFRHGLLLFRMLGVGALKLKFR